MMLVSIHRAARAIALLILTLSAPVQAQNTPPAALEAIRQADMRLAAIGYRLSSGAAELCDRLEPGTGIQFHTLAQYAQSSRGMAQTHFGFAGPIAVEGVIPGSPAAVAGVRPDDTLVEINGVTMDQAVPTAATTQTLVDIHHRFAQLPPSAPIDMVLLRQGEYVRATVTPVPACYSRYELRIADTFDARANGELIQITSKSLEQIDAEILPAMLAHELAHNILRHRERLSAAGADFGFGSGFGSSAALFRQTEIQADILAVHILARAGFAPHTAIRFWQEAGPRLLAGMIRSRSHPSLRDRVAIARAEASLFTGSGTLPPPPPFLAERDQPLDGEWRRYLPASGQ